MPLPLRPIINSQAGSNLRRLTCPGSNILLLIHETLAGRSHRNRNPVHLGSSADLAVDFDRYQEHVAWLAANGTHGVVVNGSLGEYQVLTQEERGEMV